MTTALIDYPQQLDTLQVCPGHKNAETSALRPCRLGLRPLWRKPFKHCLSSDLPAFSIFGEASEGAPG